MSKIKYILFALLCIPVFLYAQNFTYKSKVAQAPKDGFYKIQLTTALSAYAASHLEDLRMIDNDGKEIPFLLKKEEAYQPQTDFITYNIIEDNSDGDWQTLLIENPGQDKIDKFIFEMKNAETDRTVRISGSNDKEKWFVVRDRFYFSSMGMGSEATVRQLITFPMSDYRYFKVEIRMRDKQPLNILRAGYSSQEYKTPSYLQVSGLTYQRTDSNKKTYLRFTCTPANRIDKLVFHISAPALFKRECILRIPDKNNENTASDNINMSAKSAKFRESYPREESFELSADNGRYVETVDFLGYDKTGNFIIEISNFDNETLKIDSVTAYQLTSTLTAEMKKDKSYFLYFGDSLLSSPSYDLVYFQNKIPADAATLSIGEVQAKSVVVKEEYNKSNDKMMVWIGLGVIAVILFFLTGSMMKKMGKEA